MSESIEDQNAHLKIMNDMLEETIKDLEKELSFWKTECDLLKFFLVDAVACQCTDTDQCTRCWFLESRLKAAEEGKAK